MIQLLFFIENAHAVNGSLQSPVLLVLPYNKNHPDQLRLKINNWTKRSVEPDLGPNYLQRSDKIRRWQKKS